MQSSDISIICAALSRSAIRTTSYGLSYARILLVPSALFYGIPRSACAGMAMDAPTVTLHANITILKTRRLTERNPGTSPRHVYDAICFKPGLPSGEHQRDSTTLTCRRSFDCLLICPSPYSLHRNSPVHLYAAFWRMARCCTWTCAGLHMVPTGLLPPV